MTFEEIYQAYQVKLAARTAQAKKESDLKAARRDAIETVVTGELYKAVSAAYGIDEAQLWDFGEVGLRSFFGEFPREAHLTITLPEHAPITGDFGVKWTNDDQFQSIELPTHHAWAVDEFQPRWGEPACTELGEALDRAKTQYAAQERAQARYEQEEAAEAARYKERQAQRDAEKAERERIWSAVMNDEAGALLARLWLMIVHDREAYQERLDEMDEAHWSAVAAEERRAKNTQTELEETRRRLAAEEAARREAEDDLKRAKQRDRR